MEQLAVKYFPPDAVADSPVLRAIDDRLRSWTGTEYDDLTGFQFRMQRPSPAEAFAPGAEALPISTVHVDNNMKPHRVVTVIMYITSVPDSGHTVFPCLLEDPAADPALAQERRELCLSASEGGTATGHGVAAPDTHPLRRLAADICAGRAPGLRVAPAMGDAILFRTGVQPEPRAGEPDWRLWHAGCHVRDRAGGAVQNSGGVVKLTMQKFTERSLPIRMESTDLAAVRREGNDADTFRFFQQFDADGSEGLDPQELRRLLVEGAGLRADAEQVQRLMGSVDGDHDGVVGELEFLVNQVLWTPRIRSQQ